MTEQAASPRAKLPAWLRNLFGRRAPVSLAAPQRRKLPRIAEVLARVGREPDQRP